MNLGVHFRVCSFQAATEWGDFYLLLADLWSQNFNKIDRMMTLGHDFVPAVEIPRPWLEEYQRDLDRSKPAPEQVAS